MSNVLHIVRVPRTVKIAYSSWLGRIGGILLLAVVGVAAFGPVASPYPPDAIVGVPFAPPDGAHMLGIDAFGRDVLSRTLHGGRTLIFLAVAATGIAYFVGGGIGLLAGYRRSVTGATLMRGMDVLLAFPPLLFVLMLAAGLGPSAAVIVAGVALIHIPAVARIVQTAVLGVAVRGFVEAAGARGESLWYVLLREILPNIRATIAADAGPRLTGSILVIAALNFLGVGVQPPAADWGVMISEGRVGLLQAPLAVAVPAVLIAVLTIGVNLLADALGRA